MHLLMHLLSPPNTVQAEKAMELAEVRIAAGGAIGISMPLLLPCGLLDFTSLLWLLVCHHLWHQTAVTFCNQAPASVAFFCSLSLMGDLCGGCMSLFSQASSSSVMFA